MQVSKSWAVLSASLLLSSWTITSAIADEPADKFGLKFWKLELPLDDNNDGKVDSVDRGK